MTVKSTALRWICGVNLFAALLHTLFWGWGLIQLVPQVTPSHQDLLATTIGIGVADLIWSVPLLLLGSIGLYKGKAVGWLAAQMAHILYVYSMTFVVVRDLILGEIAPGTYLFMPFTLFAVWAARYLWKTRAVTFSK